MGKGSRLAGGHSAYRCSCHRQYVARILLWHWVADHKVVAAGGAGLHEDTLSRAETTAYWKVSTPLFQHNAKLRC